MGDRFQAIVDIDACGADACRLAGRVLEWLVAEGVVLAERTRCVPGQPLGHPPGPHWERAVTDDWDLAPSDGLAVHTRRTGFTSGADMPGAAHCPHCAAPTPLDGPDDDTAWQRFSTAMRIWHDTGAATVDCPACATAVPVQDWTWDEAPVALGHLGFEFWNWPDLTAGFRARLTALLGGHRTVYVWGRF
ncbi:hypothetical protein ACFFKE_22495 [Streptomyces mutabilis]|uniref:hypothetical protein n=1 Tax=Streptomyces mutabilis TaxID=67332 RepID=UPI00178169C2|nr:hypothetical protein [Streptomyces mutabilis]GGQ08539.1 hypothetical protein GCM10010279_15100 [Streptomyces mutabilis]